MEHFFNRRPTKGYIDYVELEIQKKEGGARNEEGDVTVPYHISKAACYVEDAKDGRLANGKGKMSDMSHKIQLCFFIQTHTWWSRFIYICIVFMSLLVFFEPSSSAAITVCKHKIFNFTKNKKCTTHCRDDLIIPWQEWTLFIEVLMITVFISDVLMKQAYMKPHVYWTKKWHKISGFFIVMFILDWLIFVIMYSVTKSGIRFSRPFRPVLLLTRYRELRRILETLLSMKKDLIRQIALIVTYIVLFAWVGVTLYGDTYHFTSECVDLTIPDVAEKLKTNDKYCMENTCWNTSNYPFCVCGAEQVNCILTGCDDDTNKFKAHYLPEDYSVYNGSFSQILIGTVRLMVQLSTENYPDLILPAYKQETFNIFYFILFMFIGMFLFMSVLLAVIVEFWLTYLKKTNDNEKRKERLGITKAFAWIDAERNYCIDDKSWNQLILLLKKDFTKTQSQFMFDMLDWEDKGYLDVLDFLDITEALTLRYNVRNMASSIENTKYGAIARKILGFKYTFNCRGFIQKKTLNIAKIAFGVVVLHTILALACTLHQLNLIDTTTKTSLRIINSLLIIMLVIEQGMRLFSKGFHSYLQNLTNRWEMITVAVAFFSMIGYWITLVMTQNRLDKRSMMFTVLDLFQIAWELLIILRPSIVGTIIIFFYKVINVLAELFFFIIIIVYVFAVIGLELFAVHSNAPDENYFQQYNCGIGFESPVCACLTMWQQITTSNWHDMMNSVAQASGDWAYIYFCIFYLTINLVLLDLTIAMTIEMYNAIKSQFFTTNKSSDEGEESEGVVFQIQSQASYFRHNEITGGGLPERKKSSVPCFGLGLQVTKSSGGSWRKSVLDSDAGKINTDDLDKIQKSIDGEKIGHGKDKGKLYMNSKDSDVNVRQMYVEKQNESKSLDQPECVLHFWFPVLDHQDQEVGEMVMEMKDHHSHECNIKLNFNISDPSLHPQFGKICCVVNGEEQIYMENIAFLSKERDELMNTDHDWHGFQAMLWTIKKSQRVQLKKDYIKVQVYLIDINNPQMELSEDEAQKMILTAHIRGYDVERKRWDDKQKEIKQTRKIFGDISFLLQKNAYRVAIKQNFWTEGQDTETQREDAEKGKRGKTSQRPVYVMNKDSDDKLQDKATAAWKRCLTIEKAMTTMKREEAKGAILKVAQRVSVLSNMISNPATRSRILGGKALPSTSAFKHLPSIPPRSMSLANIMVGAAMNPVAKAKLSTLSVRRQSRSQSKSPSPSKLGEDPLDKFQKLAEMRAQNNEESGSSDEIHSDDNSDDADNDADKDSEDSNDSDSSRDVDEIARKSSTGSIYGMLKLGIKATRRSLTPSPSPTPYSLQPPDSSDPQTSPVSAKSCASKSFPSTPEPKTKVLNKLKRAVSSKTGMPKKDQQKSAKGLTVVITAPDQDQIAVEVEEPTHIGVTRTKSAPPISESSSQNEVQKTTLL